MTLFARHSALRHRKPPRRCTRRRRTIYAKRSRRRHEPSTDAQSRLATLNDISDERAANTAICGPNATSGTASHTIAVRCDPRSPHGPAWPRAANDQMPPPPPLQPSPLIACDPDTDMDVLWHIAREMPELRRWLVANPRADAALLEYVAQAGGPGVTEALLVLLGEEPVRT